MLMQDRPSENQISFGRDSYDNCVADLDEQLGRLIDELERRSILEHTWVIITADHGESFGENHGVFWHGRACTSRSFMCRCGHSTGRRARRLASSPRR